MPASYNYTFKIPCSVTPVQGDVMLFQGNNFKVVDYISYDNGEWGGYTAFPSCTVTFGNGILTVSIVSRLSLALACFVPGPNH